MSKGALDRKRFEAIETYVLGTMPAAERSLFEGEMSADADLREEVELQRENTLAIELGGVSRVLKEIGAEHAREEHRLASSGAWRPYLKYAAVVAVLITGAVWLMLRPSVSERLFAAYHVVDPGLPVPMSATDDPAFQDAMVSFKQGRYEEARGRWALLLSADPNNDTLRFYIASASLAADDAPGAIPLFERISQDGSSEFRERSQWYLFLAYLRTGELDKVKAMPLEDDPTYGERVRAIKGELK